MSRHDDRVRLRHMLDDAREARTLAANRSREALKNDRLLQLALARLIEIIGEAASQIGTETRNRHGEIPWKAIIGMRNRVIHGYERLSVDVLWDTVVDDLPPVIRALETIVGPDASPIG